MGTISSGTGLISGMNIQGLVDQLMAIEARPRQLVEKRVAVLQSQKTAFLDINARVLTLKTAGSKLSDEKLYQQRSVTSSNESVVTATATDKSPLGTFSLAVESLVSTHQLITRGFADTETTAVGAGTLRFESHRARLDGDVRLTDLNGAAGVDRGKIRITDRSGATAEIDLTTAVTLDDVLDEINSNSSINVSASYDGDRLVLNDKTSQTASNLIVQEVGGTSTAADLGLLGNVASSQIAGSQINSIGSDTALDTLNDGLGVRIKGGGVNDLTFSLRDGSSVSVSLDGAQNIGEVIEAINAADSNLNASVAADGVSLQVEDLSTGTDTFSIAAANGSNAGEDLGIIGSDGDADGVIDGDRVIASLGSKLIKNVDGGGGLTAGTVRITDRSGASTDIDLSTARSVADVVDLINDSGAGVTASLNSAGTGLKLTDTTGATASDLIVQDISGDLADTLGLATAGVAANTIDGGDADLKWISETTRLDSLNGGKGVTEGKFRITDSDGVSAVVDLTQGETTIGQVLAEINSRGIGVTARINDAGDGIVITDTAGGAATMTIEEVDGTTAKDLGIVGEATAGQIDGSFEKVVEIDADDTLKDVATKITDAGYATASIINDGSSSRPYRLNLSSNQSGVAGQIVFDDGGLDFSASTLIEGRDAVALFGSADPTQALLLTSSSNQLSDTITGVTIDLHATTASPVEITIARDNSGIKTAVESFVNAFNGTVETLAKYDKYDAETKERGLLLGDSTVGMIRNRLYNLVNSRSDVSGRYEYLTQVGFSIGNGAKLSFDEAKFNEALATDYDAVVELFTATETGESELASDLPDGVTTPGSSSTTEAVGFATRLEELAETLTNSVDGTLTLKAESIDAQVESSQDRIEQLNELLAKKRERLETEFLAMEQALAKLQSQQSALASLAGAASALQMPQS